MPPKSAKGGQANQPPDKPEKSSAAPPNQKAGAPAASTTSVTTTTSTSTQAITAKNTINKIKENITAIQIDSSIIEDSESDNESTESNEIQDEEMLELSNYQLPTTVPPTTTVQPISPLKQQRKRPRSDTIYPQKPARPTSKEDSGVLRQGLLNGLQDALNFLQQASITSPSYSFYSKLEDSLKNAIEEVKQPKPQGLASSTWAEVASKANSSPKQVAKARTKAKAKAIPKESKEDLQVILRLKKGPTRPTLQSHTLRNSLNKALGQVAITSVELSARGNIVITTSRPYTANQLLEKVDIWKNLFKSYLVEAIEKPTSWVKLVAHGVPVLSEIDTISIFQQEVETFNPVKVKGTSRWLKIPTEEKRAGSVVFTVPTEEEGAYSLTNGLYIAGVKVKVVAYKAYTYKTQCYRCQGYGHNPTTCNKPISCAICGKKHLTKMHKCKSCNASQQCEHIQPYCINCKGKHTSNNKDCEVYKAIIL